MGIGHSHQGAPPADSNMKDFINNEINSHKVVIWSKSYCGYCSRTKALFRNEFPNVTDVQVHELDSMGADGRTIQQELVTMTGQRTVPNVWVDGKHVGGNDDTQAAFRSGQLKTMLGL